ncbi:MAG: recombinase RecT [Flavobacteriales bacterium]|nr:recombinase RecT [Flavobacteriales bacterium]
MSNLPSKITIKEYISAPAVQKKMNEMLVDKDTIRNFTTSLISISGQDALLAEAEPRSLFNAALEAASMNLPISKSLGFAHIIGYKNNKKGGVVEAQFQMGARGFKELAQRTGRYTIINETEVKEGEVKSRNRLTGEVEFAFIEDDVERGNAKTIGYVSFFRLDNGYESTLYWTNEQIEAHARKYSQSFKSGYGPWKDNFDAMALKTVMKRNIKNNGPLDINLQRALDVDQAIIRDDKIDYIDGNDLLANEEATDVEEDAILAAQEEAAELEKNTDKTTGEIKDTKKGK